MSPWTTMASRGNWRATAESESGGVEPVPGLATQPLQQPSAAETAKHAKRCGHADDGDHQPKITAAQPHRFGQGTDAKRNQKAEDQQQQQRVYDLHADVQLCAAVTMLPTSLSASMTTMPGPKVAA